MMRFVAKLEKYLSVVAIIASFLFLPEDNWVFWFSRESALYGEFWVETAETRAAVAKNMMNTAVALEGEEVERHLMRQIGAGLSVSLGQEAKVVPRSYALLELSPTNTERKRWRSNEGGQYFAPHELLLLAPAEQDLWALRFVTVAVGFLLLGGSVGAYISLFVSEQDEITTSCEEAS